MPNNCTNTPNIIDLFIEDKLTDDVKSLKLKEIQDELTSLELMRLDTSKEVGDKEQLIDGAVMFLTQADRFWNLGTLEVRKQIQDLIFPEGVYYGFDEGFGTVTLSQSHQLIKSLAANNADNYKMVVPRGIEPRLPE